MYLPQEGAVKNIKH